MRIFGMFARALLFGVLLGGTVLMATSTGAAAESKTSLPKFSHLEKAVADHFKTLPNYQPGDIITRSQVEPLLKRTELFGWLGAERETILAQFPLDGDFLVTQLRTPAGRELLKKIEAYPDGIDRLDRWSRMNHGHKTVQSLIRLPVAEKLIEFMATKPGGTTLGNHEAKAPGGAHFNQPTGRIYTVEMLLARLKQSHRAKAAAIAAH